jgi:hypothetical protein
MLNGEKPQSSVEPSLSLGMKLDALTSASRIYSGLSDWALRHAYPDVGHLRDTVRVVAQVLPDGPVSNCELNHSQLIMSRSAVARSWSTARQVSGQLPQCRHDVRVVGILPAAN